MVTLDPVRTEAPTPLPRLGYSVAETLRMLPISERFLRERIADGDVRVVRFGRRVIVPASELARLLGEFPAESP